MKRSAENNNSYTREEQHKMWSRDMSRIHKVWVENPCEGTASSFLDAYANLTQQTMETNDPLLVELFAQYFTTILNLHIKDKRDMNIATHNMICRVLSKKKTVDELLKVNGADRALAWFCSYIAVNIVYDRYALPKNIFKRQNQFAALLEHWTGNTFPVNKPPTLESVIVHIYGEVCWNLLGSDIHVDSPTEKLREAIDNIHNMGLPFIFKSSKDATILSHSALPQDMAP